MPEINNEGQPVLIGGWGGTAQDMTLRDYFIAHAPAEPWPWFVPVMPPKPEPVIPYPREPSDAEKEELAGLWDWLTFEDLEQPRVRAYADDQERWRKAMGAWTRDGERQRYIQWPAAWADAMLTERAKGGAS